MTPVSPQVMKSARAHTRAQAASVALLDQLPQRGVAGGPFCIAVVRNSKHRGFVRGT